VEGIVVDNAFFRLSIAMLAWCW